MRITKLLLLSSAACLASMPINAAIILTSGNVPGSLDTVHLDGNLSPTVVQGDVGGIFMVNIAGNEAITPSADGMGQPWVTAVDGGLNALTFTLIGNLAFDAIEFNLNPPNGAPVPYSVTLSALGPNGSNSQTFNLNGGNSFFNAYTTEGWRLTSVAFNTSQDLLGVGQIRIGGVSAVPEPTSWGLMVVGFGLLGAALRHRRAAGGMQSV